MHKTIYIAGGKYLANTVNNNYNYAYSYDGINWNLNFIINPTVAASYKSLAYGTCDNTSMFVGVVATVSTTASLLTSLRI